VGIGVCILITGLCCIFLYVKKKMKAMHSQLASQMTQSNNSDTSDVVLSSPSFGAYPAHVTPMGTDTKKSIISLEDNLHNGIEMALHVEGRNSRMVNINNRSSKNSKASEGFSTTGGTTVLQSMNSNNSSDKDSDDELYGHTTTGNNDNNQKRQHKNDDDSSTDNEDVYDQHNVTIGDDFDNDRDNSEASVIDNQNITTNGY